MTKIDKHTNLLRRGKNNSEKNYIAQALEENDKLSLSLFGWFWNVVMEMEIIIIPLKMPQWNIEIICLVPLHRDALIVCLMRI